MVRTLKVVLPIVAILLLGMMFMMTKNVPELTEIPFASGAVKERIKSEQVAKPNYMGMTKDGDVFYSIQYSGLDMAGNRYILKSEEAKSSKSNQELVKMKSVEAIFYFKDDTILYVWSDEGLYNNRTLDMNFYGNVRANYEGSKLFAQKAEYSNTKSFLTISENVKISDMKGTMVADKLLFDIKKQTLNIASFNDGKINANINLK